MKNFLIENIYYVRHYVPPRHIEPSVSDFVMHVFETIFKRGSK